MMVAESFAKALKKTLLTEKQSITEFLEILTQVQDVLKQEEVKRFFVSPMITNEVKRSVLRKSLKSYADNRVLLSFLFLLLDKNCFDQLSFITEKLTNMNNQLQGKIIARVQTHQILSADVKQAIVKFLEKFFRKSVELEEKRSLKYIGGLKVQACGFVFNHTILFHLKQMESQVRSKFYDDKS